MNKMYILGIELGSTRIKSVLTDESATVLASGAFEWENTLVDGLWSYSLEDALQGLQTSITRLAADFADKYGRPLRRVCAIGISAMMHGYLALDGEDRLLVPFRTWRNTNAEQAAEELTELLQFNIPMRWSVSHYYQAILNGEPHVGRIRHLTTLAGWIHYRLTGRKVLGVGDASGMFPIKDGDYDRERLERLNARLREKGIDTPLEALLPTVLTAGEDAGTLTEEGARLLDPTGTLEAGCILCPPEGDAGTGMVATCSITPRLANVSAGTSAFLMAVLEKDLEHYYKEIDVVTTPHGAPVAMVHVNNFTSEINAWVNLFEEVLALGGAETDRGALFDALFKCSVRADASCGGLTGYNFLAGEPIVAVPKGIPMITRRPDGRLTLPNFMRMQIFSALGALACGCEMLAKEDVALDRVCGHGGFFKTPEIGQAAMSAAVGAPITVMSNAGEGGAWGIAVLALFAYLQKGNLDGFLAELFAAVPQTTVSADAALQAEFDSFMKRYKSGLKAQRSAAELL